MLFENKENDLLWKNIKDDVWISHFTSHASKQNIYVKKIHAKKSSLRPVTIFLFHDLTSYHGRFHHMTCWFQNHFPEVSFVLMDFVGHGLSNGTRVHIEDMEKLTTDMMSLLNFFKKNENDKWVMLGHGMGGVGLLDLMSKNESSLLKKIDKLVLSNFILNFTSPLVSLETKIATKFHLDNSFINQTRPLSIYSANEVLSSIEAQVHYINDPLVSRAPTFQSLMTINQRVKYLFQESYFLDKPTLILKSQSEYSLSGGLEAFGKGFKKGLLSKKSYSNFKHDLYNEKESQIVFNDISEWISL